MADDLSDAISANAQGPQKVSVDGTTVEQHSLEDQILADQYLGSKAAANGKRRGLVINKLRPPGSV